MRRAAGTLKRVTLELGGKSPNIVFEDADLDSAVNGSLFAIYYSAGQSLRGPLAPVRPREHLRPLRRAVRGQGRPSCKVGDPLDPATQMGSLISRASSGTRVHGYVELGKQEGAEVLVGGGRPQPTATRAADQGNFYLPTALGNVDNQMRVAQEEIFGPVVTISRFSTEAEAIQLANDVIYGLAGTHVDQATWAAPSAWPGRSSRGVVTINTPYTAFPGLPFGGYKQSGFGRELSMETLNLYTELKSVLIYTGEKPVNPFGLLGHEYPDHQALPGRAVQRAGGGVQPGPARRGDDARDRRRDRLRFARPPANRFALREIHLARIGDRAQLEEAYRTAGMVAEKYGPVHDSQKDMHGPDDRAADRGGI